MTKRVGLRSSVSTLVLLAAAALLGACGGGGDSKGTTGKASATPGMAGISFTLEGCRNNGDISLPNGGGDFICPDASYTTGNLGKGWNELDLVPHRLTVSAGNAAPAYQAFRAVTALDNRDDSMPGYDVISALVLNTALSDGACEAATSGAQASMEPGAGGMDATIYRLNSFTQHTRTTCVYDFYGRLALGSHLFPGSSLHANLLNEDLDTSGIGSKEVSIPVKEILPQSIAKTMGASQGSDHAWRVSKSGPAQARFDNVCDADSRASQQVQITVKWERLEAVPGDITVVATISATNPASRAITVAVTDDVYLGADGQGPSLHTSTFDPVDVPANTTMVVGTDSFSLPAGTASVGDWLSDVAHATYTDLATGIAVPGDTTAQASAQIQQGTITNSTAGITDHEWMTGAGLTFSVATPAFGSFGGGYTAGTQTAGPVDWDSGTQGGSGELAFTKSIALGAPWITSGTLSDTAHLAGANGFNTDSGQFDVPVSSSARVTLHVVKTIPSGFLMSPDTATVTFHVSRDDDSSFGQDVSIVLDAAHATGSSDVTGLAPGIYKVAETGITYSQALYPALAPVGGSTETVDLSVPSEDPDHPFSRCSGTAQFDNDIPAGGLASAQVRKTTYPALSSSEADYSWSFRLTGPGGVNETVTAGAGAGYVGFASTLLRPGVYTVTETGKSGWDKTSPSGNCTFTVAYPGSAGTLYSCDFVNTKRAKAGVVKTYKGAPLTGTQSFTFQLRSGASPTANGTVLETQMATGANGGVFAFATSLTPGQTYQVCEVVMAGWITNIGTFSPGSFLPPDGVALNPSVDNSTVCGNFTPTPGQVVTFTVNNDPPPGGRALTIGYWKNWASCTSSSSNKKPVLDNVLATFPVVAPNTRPGVYFGLEYVDTCVEAVALLDKSTLSGKKSASDAAFNMAAQLMAADLNIRAGAGFCPGVTTAITGAHGLLAKYRFDGNTHDKISAADTATMNGFATTLDRFNNDVYCQ